MNPIGLVAAVSAFLSVWLGHVLVRRTEFLASSIRFPALLFLGCGGTLEYLSMRTRSLALSAAIGILGITLLWDALELFRQEHRVRNGHAPANPLNPRHAEFLAAPRSSATTVDVLKREPVTRHRLSD